MVTFSVKVKSVVKLLTWNGVLKAGSEEKKTRK